MRPQIHARVCRQQATSKPLASCPYRGRGRSHVRHLHLRIEHPASSPADLLAAFAPPPQAEAPAAEVELGEIEVDEDGATRWPSSNFEYANPIHYYLFLEGNIWYYVNHQSVAQSCVSDYSSSSSSPISSSSSASSSTCICLRSIRWSSLHCQLQRLALLLLLLLVLPFFNPRAPESIAQSFFVGRTRHAQ